MHAGLRLQLTTRDSPGVKRAVLAADLSTDEPYAYSVLGGNNLEARCHAVNEFEVFYHAKRPHSPRQHRPTRAALTHMRILQAFAGRLPSFWCRLRRRQRVRINVLRPLLTCFVHVD